jgi:TRAP-type C4-dicarboxylate transport system permease small subunit
MAGASRSNSRRNTFWGGSGVVIAKLRLLLPAAFFAAVTCMSGGFAYRAFARGEIEYGVIDWPLGWAYAAIPLGCGVLVIRLFYDALGESARD